MSAHSDVTQMGQRNDNTKYISPYHTVVELQSMTVILFVTWSHEKIQTLFILLRYGKIQHTSSEFSVPLKAHTLLNRQVLYFPISHPNELRLHIFSHLRSGFQAPISVSVHIAL